MSSVSHFLATLVALSAQGTDAFTPHNTNNVNRPLSSSALEVSQLERMTTTLAASERTAVLNEQQQESAATPQQPKRRRFWTNLPCGCNISDPSYDAHFSF